MEDINIADLAAAAGSIWALPEPITIAAVIAKADEVVADLSTNQRYLIEGGRGIVSPRDSTALAYKRLLAGGHLTPAGELVRRVLLRSGDFARYRSGTLG